VEDWVHPEGLRTFALLLKEIDTQVEPVESVLRAAISAFCDSLDVPPDITRFSF